MERLAEYLHEFARLLGIENAPHFKGLRNESTGLMAAVPSAKARGVTVRLHKAKSDPSSAAAGHLRTIESMLGQDGIKKAELESASGKVVYLFRPEVQAQEDVARIYQSGSIDGTVTGIRGADDTMQLYVRDRRDRDLNITIRDEELARSLLKQFRHGFVRLYVRGIWIRGDDGWMPEAKRCLLERYDVLEESPLTGIFAALAEAKGNGWALERDPYEMWRSIREGD